MRQHARGSTRIERSAADRWRIGEWLHQEFGVPLEDSWQSGYRFEMLGDGIGSDELGYDFRIVTGDRTRLFEVKASTEGAYEFTLAESEVRRAQSLAADEEYIVVFVPHVFDPTQRDVIPLPNPFGHGGLRRYRMSLIEEAERACAAHERA